MVALIPRRIHLLGALVVGLILPRSLAVTPLSAWQQGISTNYGGAQDGLSPDQPSFGTKDGSCGYTLLDKGTWPYWSVAAVATSNSFYINGPIEACGMCFEIQCLNNAGQYAGRCNTQNPVSVIVQITDKCPECLSNQFDIQALTFNKLAPMAIGRIDMQYRRVECVPPSQMVIFVDNNNGPGGWLRLFVEQAGGQAAVSLVQVRTSNSGAAWTSLNNVYGSDWEINNCPSYPLDVSIVGPDGQTVTAFGVITASGQIGDFPTQAQFRITNPTDNLLTAPVDGSSGSSSSSSTSSSTSPPVTTGSGSPPGATSPPPALSPPSPGGTTATSPPGTPPGPPATPPPPGPPTTGTSPPSPGTSGSSGGSCSSCTDVPTPVWSCAQQVTWGACSNAWMVAGDANAPQGWCAQSCGRCKC